MFRDSRDPFREYVSFLNPLLRSRHYDAALQVDIFSLGVIIYEVICRHMSFEEMLASSLSGGTLRKSLSAMQGSVLF